MRDNVKKLPVDELLSPDEEHKIEVRVDKMLSLRPPAGNEPEQTKPTTEEPATPSSESVATEPAQPVPVEPEPQPGQSEPPSAPEAITPQVAPVEDEIAKLAAEQAASEAETEPTPEPSQEPTMAPSTADISDAELSAAFKSGEPAAPGGNRFKRLLHAWWGNKKARWASMGVLALLLVAVGILPVTRAWALNSIGLRATASLTVLDGTTQLPLKGAKVSIGSAIASSDDKGVATLHSVKLGSQTLSIKKVAFAAVTRHLTVGLGANKAGSVALRAVGAQYKFKLIDYASGRPITSARAASGESTAEADKQGLVTLTVPDPSGDSLTVSITSSNYRTESVTIKADATGDTTVQLVTTRQEVYVSKQSGKYDVYKSDLDGQHKQVILKGTGTETGSIALVPNQAQELVALVDTRDGIHDNGGYLLQTLTVINTNSGAPTTVDHSQKIQIIDWFGDRLVYVTAKAGASAANPSRYQLFSYNTANNQRQELDHANAFNDVVSAAGAIYYATSNQYNGGVSQFVKMYADGTGKQVLLTSEVWNIYRTGYLTFALVGGEASSTYKLGDAKPTPSTTAYNSNSRLYIDSPDGKHSLWIDTRDGKGTLIMYDVGTQTETTIAALEGLDYPVRWLGNDTIIYRLHTAKETGDYVTSTAGGTSKKITDVTGTTGVSRWYFY